MKTKIGSQNVLYPMPVTLIGSLVNGRVNFINIAHVGILSVKSPKQPHLISLGMNKIHFTNSGIKETKTFSVNLMSVEQIIPTDYIGLVSGKNTDKSQVFESFYGELKTAPIIKDAPLSMECKLYDIYDLPDHDVFIGEIIATYADEKVMENGKVNLAKVNPLLFDMSSVQYWSLGKPIGKAWGEGQNYMKR